MIRQSGSQLGRFIPVLTGNTVAFPSTTSIWPVYPRTYGEHIDKGKTGIIKGGLSPYLRGTRKIRNFINARNAVYPRTYGEHPAATQIMLDDAGLSPYLRGTPQ
ncbi:hypothetical protein XNC1_1895 [Xenorhabdus nematophila ATCC 19061]|uniref:Uncharacterized protein n=1 Tax=Xenorhabdus nematophila (strain ATCC 19061 / DSM 3370 / CCUG 14189 / LMG 1036 / NCIMB 9965 / AN6) TaxID=406817 RepID=D3VDN8_XENNA|nr:hypothetical protein XNC1_1895 [Xenorhabdus nematophila ATCC 19061]